jgi:hypothetical protein
MEEDTANLRQKFTMFLGLRAMFDPGGSLQSIAG